MACEAEGAAEHVERAAAAATGTERGWERPPPPHTPPIASAAARPGDRPSATACPRPSAEERLRASLRRRRSARCRPLEGRRGGPMWLIMAAHGRRASTTRSAPGHIAH